MKAKNALLAAACVGGLGLNRLVMAQFVPGDLEVVTNLSRNIGGSPFSTALDSNAVAITQWNPSATGQTAPTFQVNLPTVTSGAQSAFYMDGNVMSDGQLSLSTDGQNLVLGGWAGTFSTKSSGTPTVNRVVAVINASGSVDTSTVIPVYSGTVYSNGVGGTALTNYLSAFPAAVMSGNQIWVAGQASNPYEMGVMTTTFGSTAPATQIGAPNAGPVPTTLTIYNNQLYTSQQSVLAQANATATAVYPTQQALYGPATVGTGLPTTPSSWTDTYLAGTGTASNSYSAPTNPVTQLNGFGSAYTSVLGQANSFAFADGGSTIYIGTTDGVEKWVNENGTWTELWQSYSGIGTNYDGLPVSTVGSLVVEPDPSGLYNDIYVTSGFNNTSAPDVIGEIQDPNLADGGDFESSVPSTFSIIATAPSGEYFRGIAFAPVAVPEPASMSLIALAGVGLLGRRRRV